ncbi:MAG: hypothetical protein HFE85_02685 [Clostridiales bacterium]|nr:hypothetical protein [Clostridiales bacterium]
MKLVGLLLIIAVGAAVGFLKSTEYSNRVRQLEAAVSFINDVSTRIRYSAAPIDEIIEQAAHMEQLKPLSFLPDCAVMCRTGEAFPAAWKQALTLKQRTLSLKGRDMELLQAFGAGLGATDVEGQLSHCALYEKMLEETLQQARRDKETHGRLTASLGVLAGIGTAVLLI